MQARRIPLLALVGLLVLPGPALASSNVTIENNGGVDTNATFAAGTYTPTGDNAIIDAGLLNGRLATGDVVVNTASGSSQAGTITVSSPVSWSSAQALTLAADSSVVIGTPVTGAMGTLTAEAPNGGIAEVSPGLAAVQTATFDAGTLYDVNLDQGGNSFGGTIHLSARNANVVAGGGIDLGSSPIAGNLTVDATGGDIIQSGAVTSGGSSSFTAGATHDVALTNPANSFALVSIPAARNADIKAGSSINLGSISTAGNLAVSLGSGNIAGGPPELVAGHASFATAASGDVTLPSGGNDFAGPVSVTSARNATVNDTNGLDYGATSLSGSLQSAAGSIAQSAPIVVAGTASLTSGPGSVVLSNAANDFGGAVGVLTAPGQNGIVTDANNLTLGGSGVGANLVGTAGNAVTVPASTLLSAGARTTLVSDAHAPTSPAIGGGGVSIGAGAKITARGGPVALYTARRGQNSIAASATLNGAHFTPGPLFVDTARERWGTYFPSGPTSAPFTILYKDEGRPAPPQTKLKRKPKRKVVTTKPKARVRFAFSSSVAGSTFLCKLDRKAERRCASPLVARLKPGRHTFRVRARIGGVVDRTPAKVAFKVVRRHRR